nr:MAG TPA: hypothetical protein [Caudoviricetes sp.]
MLKWKSLNLKVRILTFKKTLIIKTFQNQS